MKNLLIIILFTLIGKYSFAQFPSKQTIGAPLSQTQNRGATGADSGYVQASFPDTITANKGFLKGIAGLTIRVADTLFTRSNDLSKWVAAGAVNSIKGTVNQVLVSSPTGQITLSLPQNIATNSYPKFSSDTLSAITIGSATDSVMTVDALGVPHKRNVTSIGKQGDSLIIAGTVSSIPSIGDVVGNNITAGNFIQQEFFKSQPPTASLSGGTTTELHSAGTFTPTLNWSGGRQLATQPLTTINVAGTNETFTQPSQGGAPATGTQVVTVTYNTPITFTNTVTTTDAKAASATTSFNFLPQRYWGVSTGTPVGSDLIASVGGGQELSNSIAKGAFVITVSGSTKNVFYAYPASEGALSSIIISGLESIGAFTQSTLLFTNASGYQQSYYLYKSNNTFSSTTVSFNSVN